MSITGWSLGGAVSLFSAWLPIKNAITKELSFASHLPIYPPCFVDPENTDFTDAPIHILIGEIDNWTPAKPCTDFVKKINKKGNFGLTIYTNSHNSFDSKYELTQNEKQVRGILNQHNGYMFYYIKESLYGNLDEHFKIFSREGTKELLSIIEPSKSPVEVCIPNFITTEYLFLCPAK